jgi:hypothetical protein
LSIRSLLALRARLFEDTAQRLHGGDEVGAEKILLALHEQLHVPEGLQHLHEDLGQLEIFLLDEEEVGLFVPVQTSDALDRSLDRYDPVNEREGAPPASRRHHIASVQRARGGAAGAVLVLGFTGCSLTQP